jgi:hypothetical protein
MKVKTYMIAVNAVIVKKSKKLPTNEISGEAKTPR